LEPEKEIEETKEEIEVEKKSEEEGKKIVDEKVMEIIAAKGDTLLKYQRDYGVEVGKIAELNNIKKPYNIYVGQKIKIRGAGVEKNGKKEKKLKTITLEKGDTLLGLSAKYQSSVRELAEINNLSAPYGIYAGQKIKVPDVGEVGTAKAANDKRDGVYIVEKGDSLLLIAKKTDTKFNDLIKINNLEKPYNVRVGQKIFLRNGGNGGGKTAANKPEIVDEKPSVVQTAPAPVNVTVVKGADGEFSPPLRGEIIKNFGDNSNGKFFDGIVIKGAKGDAIRASKDGEVVYAGNELKDLGNIIIVKHKNNWLSIYGYCDAVNVKIKDAVRQGDVIASVGKTGIASDYQLYFAIRRGKVAVDPIKYLSK
jgi:murein DD-endopeptidase MepM/ murein hydrolase activator NlpD